MSVYRNSRGAGVWKITHDIDYMIPDTCASQEARDKYYGNSKPVDILVASLHGAEFDRVEAPSFAH